MNPFFLFNSISFTSNSLTASFSKILCRDLWKHNTISDINPSSDKFCRPTRMGFLSANLLVLILSRHWKMLWHIHGTLTGKWKCSLTAWVEFAGQKFLLNLKELLVADLQILNIGSFIWALGRKTVEAIIFKFRYRNYSRKHLAQIKREVYFIYFRHFQQEENHKGGEILKILIVISLNRTQCLKLDTIYV